jgi:hypothetical protein
MVQAMQLAKREKIMIGLIPVALMYWALDYWVIDPHPAELKVPGASLSIPASAPAVEPAKPPLAQQAIQASQGRDFLDPSELYRLKDLMGRDWERNPFEIVLQGLKSKVERAVTAVARAPMRLEGVIWGSDGPRAVIDGKLYRQGEEVQEGGAVIRSIEKSSVVLQEGQEERRLLLWNFPRSAGGGE